MKNGKPRLIFFRPVRPGLPPYIRAQLDQQVRCLKLSFEVAVVDGPCDFDRECDLFEPDLAVFESGAYAGERILRNLNAHPGLPRLGFLNADAYCPTRTVFVADMDRWGVEDFFTISVAMAEYFPAVADRMFVWANCIDRAQFPRNPARKNIPVLFTGSHAPHYPWRIRMHDLLARNYPTFTVPRFDWSTQSATMPQGEAYARLLGESWFAPSCGTIAKEVVRKHFEIPAAGACLVAENTASLIEAGFVDMVNCVFADEGNVLDKLDYLFRRPEELTAIIEAGRSLVLARHALENRNQVRQWFDLHRSGAGSRIVQDGPFGDLHPTNPTSAQHSRHVVSGGVDRMLLRQARKALAEGRPGEAESLFLRCLNHHFMPEAVFGLARVALKRGLPGEAEFWLSQSIDRVTGFHGAPLPDPVEWAYLVRAALCRGDMETAAQRALAYGRLDHPQLRRIRSVLRFLLQDARIGPAQEASSHIPSLHETASGAPREWLNELTAEMRACGQDVLADRIEASGAALPFFMPVSGEERRIEMPAPAHPAVSARLSGLRRRMASFAPKRRLRSLARAVLRRNRPTPFLTELTTLAARIDIRSALICGADPGAMLVSAVMTGSNRNVEGPVALFLAGSETAAMPRRTPANDRRADPGTLDAVTREGASLMVVATAHCDIDPDWFQRHEPAFVAIEATDRPAGSRLLRSLCADSRYSLLRSGADRMGFAVLRRNMSRAAPIPYRNVRWNRSDTAP